MVLPYDFTNMDSDSSMQLCRTLIYNEVLQFMKQREEEEEKISFVRRLSSSSKVYKTFITKQQHNPVFDEAKKKCSILFPVSLTRAVTICHGPSGSWQNGVSVRAAKRMALRSE